MKKRAMMSEMVTDVDMAIVCMLIRLRVGGEWRIRWRVAYTGCNFLQGACRVHFHRWQAGISP
jgi:hypothetical protein